MSCAQMPRLVIYVDMFPQQLTFDSDVEVGDDSLEVPPPRHDIPQDCQSRGYSARLGIGARHNVKFGMSPE